MKCTCYISKHLYERVQNVNSNVISVPLDEQELKFLDFWKVSYERDNKNKYNYIINLNELRKLFCRN